MKITTLVATVVAVGLLSACGGDNGSSDDRTERRADASDSAEPTTEPPTSEPPITELPAGDGSTITGKGYSFTAPGGWSDQTAHFKRVQPAVDKAAAEPRPKEGFANNVNVLVVPAGPDAGKSLDELAPALRSGLSQFANDVKVLPRTELDGIEAHRQAGRATLFKNEVAVEQIAVIVGDELYNITVTMRMSTPAAERKAAADAVIASWRWRDPPTV
ncbi:hypothetical protein [Nocardioides speluncae]|uniref:hypothetical protein n=1 Tax=Nocardioides speluncae TaxID=2670337 RepID=UPI0012B1704E|nr:hypothetical protein [Nocardioides speluncae]